jgi:ABC-type transporter Mla subunit MlaD
MPSRVHWSDLSIGLIAMIVIVAAAVSILLFARVGALHGDTETLYVTTDDATGVLAGTEVWLIGQKVGLVKAVRFRPVTTDTLQRVAIETEILADRMKFIRRNSRPDIRPGGNLIGSPVVYIRAGTTDAPPVRNGDTLASRSSSRMAAVGTQIDTLGSRLTALSASTEHLMEELNSPSTTAGALRTRGVGQIASANAVVSTMIDRAKLGSGSLGLAYRGAVGERLKRVFAEKDSIALLLSSGRGNVGRFRRDSTLPRQVARVRAEVDSIRALLFNPQSGVARLRSDTTLKSGIARARVELDSLMREIKKHPGRFISF